MVCMTVYSEHGGSHRIDAPSAWVTRWATMAPAGCPILDVACGSGRHARYFAERGHLVDAVDRDAAALASLADCGNVAVLRADLEAGEWPYGGRTFGVIVVTNYLHRPLFPVLLDSIAAGGVLIYETFAAGNERYGRPSNPGFLLRPGELLEVARGSLRVLAYEDLYVPSPKPAMVQRICAQRPPPQ